MEHLKQGRIYLRALNTTDLDQVHAWHNDPQLYQFLGSSFRWVSRVTEEEWLRRRCMYSTTEVNLGICLTDTDEHIGNVYLRDIAWIERHAEVHIFIAAATHRGQGYGDETMKILLSHAFHDLALERVYLFVLASNHAAQRLYLKCGFREEGRLRRHAFKRGQYDDVIVMGILKTEWEFAQQ